MHAATQSPNPSSNAHGVACGGLFSVAAAVEFARQRRGDCSTLITYVALRETGMLDDYMEKIAHSGSVPPEHNSKPVIATRASGKFHIENS